MSKTLACSFFVRFTGLTMNISVFVSDSFRKRFPPLLDKIMLLFTSRCSLLLVCFIFDPLCPIKKLASDDALNTTDMKRHAPSKGMPRSRGDNGMLLCSRKGKWLHTWKPTANHFLLSPSPHTQLIAISWLAAWRQRLIVCFVDDDTRPWPRNDNTGDDVGRSKSRVACRSKSDVPLNQPGAHQSCSYGHDGRSARSELFIGWLEWNY